MQSQLLHRFIRGVKSSIFLAILWMTKKIGIFQASLGIHPSPTEIRSVLSSYQILFSVLNPARTDVTVTDNALGGVPAWRATPALKPHHAILYLHGGGYFLGLEDTASVYRPIVTELAHRADAETFAIDYRLVPENPATAPLEDAYIAYLALLEMGIAPDKLFIAGDSAGGGLTLALLLKLCEQSKPLPKAAILISPWSDLALTGESITSRADRETMFTNNLITRGAETALHGHLATDPQVSPLYGDYKGLPPLLIFAGGREMLYDDARRVAEKAKLAGVDVTFNCAESMIHVYPVFYGIFNKGAEAIDQIVQFIEHQLETPGCR